MTVSARACGWQISARVLAAVCGFQAMASEPVSSSEFDYVSAEPRHWTVLHGPEVQGGTVGVLLMAHGGSREWNEAVEQAVEPLRRFQPAEIAFGMAAADTVQNAVLRLEAAGVRSIAVVRLFMDAESFLDRTEQILGFKPGAPARPHDWNHGHDHGGGPDSMPFWRVESISDFFLSREGLLDGPFAGLILLGRARSLSRDPARESVLILAHGVGDNVENERWLARMEGIAEGIRSKIAFRAVRTETLREDWPEQRAEAEHRIRDFVSRAREEGGTAIVIPARLFGFGPYAHILSGLEYTADGQGLLPHPLVTDWIQEQADRLRAARWPSQKNPT